MIKGRLVVEKYGFMYGNISGGNHNFVKTYANYGKKPV